MLSVKLWLIDGSVLEKVLDFGVEQNREIVKSFMNCKRVDWLEVWDNVNERLFIWWRRLGWRRVA